MLHMKMSIDIYLKAPAVLYYLFASEMLRVEHERSLAEALKDMEEKMKAEAGQTLGLIRAQLTGTCTTCCIETVVIAVTAR